MNFIYKEDTICAIATPVGEGGVGIIKISGPEALSIAKALFKPRRSEGIAESHRLYYGWIIDPGSGDVVDEVLLSFMAGPCSYTREDIVEINCHSGFAVLSRIMELVLASGAKLAEPGEFTKRAFLNGRLDLSQAEAVIEIIQSRTHQSLLLANRHLQGEFREKVEAWRECLLSLHAEVEAGVDFAEDLDDDSSNSLSLISRLDEELITPLNQILDHFENGRALREGITLALVGKPNVGKSSLMNALVGKERAIVTALPGTTRDVVEDCFVLSGILVKLQDTAGIRHNPDEIESIGIEKTIRSATEADIVLWLIDRSRPLNDEDDIVFENIKDTQHAILLSKADLPSVISASEVRERFGDESPILCLSVFNPSQIAELQDFLTRTYLRQPLETSRSMVTPNLRHKECLDRATKSLLRAREIILSGGYDELVTLELRHARLEMETILGLSGDADLLDRIFSQFCIGK
jgi:tRNA modification GTPase